MDTQRTDTQLRDTQLRGAQLRAAEGRPLEITSVQEALRREAYQAAQAPRRPQWWGVDQDLSRRPGQDMMREPQLWANARTDIEPMDPKRSTVFRHNRPNKPWPPVFGTTCPPKGLSGLVRKFAASFPDHKPQHWLLKLLGDRIDSFEHRLAKVAPVAVPLVAAGLLGRMYFAGNRELA